MRRHWTFLILKRLLGLNLPEARGREDDHYLETLVRHVRDARQIDRVALFALDGVYREDGSFDEERSHMVVPNERVMAACLAHEEGLPVISVNPDRPDALQELARWGELAVAMKWLAPLQRFRLDPRKHRSFIHMLAELKLPVIAHSGCEHTFPGVDQSLGDPLIYEPLLEAGIPVVFSHCGTGSLLKPWMDRSSTFIDLLRRHDHAFGDSAAFSSLVRAGYTRRFVPFQGRILHGPDYPVPPMTIGFLRELGPAGIRQLMAIATPFDRDALIKQALGFDRDHFEVAHQLLGSRIAHWDDWRANHLAGTT